MRIKKRDFGILVKLAVAVLMLATIATAQKKPKPTTLERQFDLGAGMSYMSSDLMQIAAKTDLFLMFADEIKLTSDQQKKLEEMFFEIQKYQLQRQTDLDVADAELRRLVSRDRVDLIAVKAKVKEVEAVQADITIKQIEAVLQAIAVLSHEQHIQVMTIVRRKFKEQLPPGTDG